MIGMEKCLRVIDLFASLSEAPLAIGFAPCCVVDLAAANRRCMRFTDQSRAGQIPPESVAFLCQLVHTSQFIHRLQRQSDNRETNARTSPRS